MPEPRKNENTKDGRQTIERGYQPDPKDKPITEGYQPDTEPADVIVPPPPPPSQEPQQPEQPEQPEQPQEPQEPPQSQE